MACARCGGPLEAFELGGQRAVVCTECGFADTPVGHEPERRAGEESWEQAIERFLEQFGAEAE